MPTSIPACEAAELHVHEAKPIAWFARGCRLTETSIATHQSEAQASALWEGKHFDVGGDSAQNQNFQVYALSDILLCVSAPGLQGGLLYRGADVVCPAGLPFKRIAIIGLWLWCQRQTARHLWSPVHLALIGMPYLSSCEDPQLLRLQAAWAGGFVLLAEDNTS
jgi:hypothetical protein